MKNRELFNKKSFGSKKESILYFEFRQFIKKQKIYLIVGFILLLGMAQIGYEDYKNSQWDLFLFTKIDEIKKAQSSPDFPLSVQPRHITSHYPATSFLVNFKSYNSLDAYIDNGILFQIVDNKKGSNLDYLTGGFISFSGILFLLLSYLSINSGLGAFKSPEMLRFVSSIKGQDGYRKAFVMIFGSRILFICVYITLILGSTVLLAFFNQINDISIRNIGALLLVGMMLSGILVFLSSSFSKMVNTKPYGLSVLMMIYFAVGIVYPWAISAIPEALTGRLSENFLEFTQYNFLKEMDERTGTRKGQAELLSDTENAHKLALYHRIDLFNKLSQLIPTTFFLTTANEISGKGMRNYIEFYDYTENIKNGIRKEYINTYLHPTPVPSESRMEALMPGLVIYPTFTGYPPYFFTGVGLSLIYFLIAGYVAYKVGYYQVYQRQSQSGSVEIQNIHIKTNEICVLFTKDDRMKNKLFNFLSGKENLKGEIEVERPGEIQSAAGQDFIYIPNTVHFADVQPEILHRFLFGTELTSDITNSEILLDYARESGKIVVMDEFLRNLEPRFVKEVKTLVHNLEMQVLIITSDYYLARELVDDVEHLYYFSGESWAVEIIQDDPLNSRNQEDLEERIRYEIDKARNAIEEEAMAA